MPELDPVGMLVALQYHQLNQTKKNTIILTPSELMKILDSS